MLGRVNSSMEVNLLGAQLTGAVLRGILAQLAGIRWALVVGSCLMVAGGVWLLLSTVWRIGEVPESDVS
ncbi:MAG TPA: hypothetical protein DC056_05295 [Dehalococcoidia bacterium]|nr:hypothetical protein [Dehalococcoidia bacterium]